MRLLVLVGLVAVLTGCASGDRPPADKSRLASTAANKKLVVDFYRTVFIEKRVVEGFERYVAPEYIQHNPLLATGREPAVKFLSTRTTRESVTDIKRVVAEGDLVVLHVHSRNNLSDRGRAVIDIWYEVAGQQP